MGLGLGLRARCSCLHRRPECAAGSSVDGVYEGTGVTWIGLGFGLGLGLGLGRVRVMAWVWGLGVRVRVGVGVYEGTGVTDDASRRGSAPLRRSTW